MKHEKIGDDARVWVVTRGPDGHLRHELDTRRFAALCPGASAEEIANALAVCAGTAEIAETRVW